MKFGLAHSLIPPIRSLRVQDYGSKIVEWFLGLGETYSVDPVIFGSIYVGAIPFFTISLAWLIRNKRRGLPLALPVISTGFWSISAYLYLFIAGENMPWWTYGLVALFFALGAYSSYRRFRANSGESPDPLKE